VSERSTGWDRHAAEQRRAWLRLTYAERLRWLEEAKRFHGVALGAARRRPTNEAIAQSPDSTSGDPGRAGDGDIKEPH
jgi:hypothetical protein